MKSLKEFIGETAEYDRLTKLVSHPTKHQIVLTDGKKSIHLGFDAKKTKKALYNAMIDNGPDIVRITGMGEDEEFSYTNGMYSISGKWSVRWSGETERAILWKKHGELKESVEVHVNQNSVSDKTVEGKIMDIFDTIKNQGFSFKDKDIVFKFMDAKKAKAFMGGLKNSGLKMKTTTNESTLYTKDGFYETIYAYLDSIAEDAPANAAGGGHVAGIGVGPKGEPGMAMTSLRRFKKKKFKQ
jgi:hypothetical protein